MKLEQSLPYLSMCRNIHSHVHAHVMLRGTKLKVGMLLRLIRVCPDNGMINGSAGCAVRDRSASQTTGGKMRCRQSTCVTLLCPSLWDFPEADLETRPNARPHVEDDPELH